MFVRVGGFLAALSILALACSSFGSDEDGSPRREPDAGKADGGDVTLDPVVTEPPSAGPRCSPTGKFGAPVLLESIHPQKPLEGLRLSADELTAYFWVDMLDGDPRDHDLFYAERASTKSPWGAPVALSTLNRTGEDDAYITVTNDGKTAYFARGEVSSRQVFLATRPSGTGQFDAPQPLKPISPNAASSDDSSPWLSPDGTTLFLSSRGREPYADSLGIFRLDRTATAPSLVPVAEVSTKDNIDSNPVITGDGRTMYLKAGGSNSDTTDIYVALWDGEANTFKAPVKVEELSTENQQDFPLWVSQDGCYLYYRNGDVIKVVKRD